MTRTLILLALFGLPALCQNAAVISPSNSPNHVFMDASKPVGAPERGFVDMGTSTSPNGSQIGINSRYLTLNGKPWFPVMGEFHYVRYPEQYWEEELLKMKAAGVQLVATYVIWIYHEEQEGKFDWSGRRDLRKFIALCRKHGLYVFVRVGPWSHAEVRNGGFPDWLMRKAPETRSNNPLYLSYVQPYFGQIANQLQGLLWKDGGPVIGIQLENEYTMRGTGRGDEHILQLKKMVRALGMDVPLYTVTGWDGAAIPPHAVVPVFGGYPDAPWDAAQSKLPPNELYLFRFENRVSGDMGAQGPRGKSYTSQEALAHYPFLAAEYGGGLQDTYHRRPVLEPDDLAAMMPVQIGSGINLYGYYMFQGGANLIGAMSTLQESQATGSATDVPAISYDFQAPLGQYGQERESFRALKIFNYFLNDFGDILAPTATVKPAIVPKNASDFSVPRVAARINGDQGFIFVNNYVRNYDMPERRDFQVTVKLPSETVTVPTNPVNIPTGAYFIWPLNLQLGDGLLKYATAQLMTKIEADANLYYFFVATKGVPPTFRFDTDSVRSLEVNSGRVNRTGSVTEINGVAPGTNAAFSFARRAAGRVFVIVLDSVQAEDLWRSDQAGKQQAVITASDLFFEEGTIHLRSRGTPDFTFEAIPQLASLRPVKAGGTFSGYSVTLPKEAVGVKYEQTRKAQQVPPVKLGNVLPWRKQPIAEAPTDELFQEDAAHWKITIDSRRRQHVSDVWLQIRYMGDAARLYSGRELLDDNFYNGLPWNIGLKRFERQVESESLDLQVLPLRPDSPVYIPSRFRSGARTDEQTAQVQTIAATPEYELVLQTRQPGR